MTLPMQLATHCTHSYTFAHIRTHSNKGDRETFTESAIAIETGA